MPVPVCRPKPYSIHGAIVAEPNSNGSSEQCGEEEECLGSINLYVDPENGTTKPQVYAVRRGDACDGPILLSPASENLDFLSSGQSEEWNDSLRRVES